MKKQPEKIYSTRESTSKRKYRRPVKTYPLDWMNRFIAWLGEEKKSESQIIEYCKQN